MTRSRTMYRAVGFALALLSAIVLPLGTPSASALARRTVHVAKVGSGRVTSDPARLNCGPAKINCSATFRVSRAVKLTATPSVGWVFESMTGCASVLGLVCKIKASLGDVTVNVTFVQLHKLTVGVKGPGKIKSDPDGIDCGDDCAQKYRDGTTVALTAKAGDGAILKLWGGACEGMATDTACVLDMTIPLEADALFANATGTATGTATPN